MAGTSYWALSGVDTARWIVQQGTLWRPPVSARAQLLQIPARHGAINVGLPVFDEPQITLLISTVGNDASLEAAQAELVGLLAAPGLTVTRRSGGQTSSAPARLVSLALADFVPDQWAQFQIVLAIPGVFLRGALATSTPTTIKSGDQVTLTNLTGSTGPCTDAVLRVTGPVTVVTVTDALTGTDLHWAGTTVPAGEYLYLDAGTLRAWRSASTSLWNRGGTDVSAGLDYHAAGPLQLWPRMQGTNPDDRRVTVTVTGNGFGATTALAVRAAPAYL